MSTTFKRLIAGLTAGLSLLVLTTTANAAVSRTTPGRGPATHAPLPGLRPVEPPRAGAHALAGRSATAAPADVVHCYPTLSLMSAANRHWVSAEVGYPTTDPSYGMLRARASASGLWERFWLCFDSTTSDWVIISAQNGDLVSAELGYPATDPRYGMLRARATGIGLWEEYVTSTGSPGC